MKPQPATTLYDPDSTASPAVARHLDFVDYAAEVPVHTHRKGQLIIARYGAVSCYAENDIWIVPPDCAVWIPGGIPHSAKASMLFFNDTATTEIYTLSLHDALPISSDWSLPASADRPLPARSQP